MEYWNTRVIVTLFFRKRQKIKINKPLDKQNLVNECQQKKSARNEISIYLIQLNVLLFFFVCDRSNCIYRLQCTRSLAACNSAINVVQRAFISMLLMKRKSSVIRLWAQCAHKHAYMKQSNEKGWRWLSVQNERNKKPKRNSTPWWSYTIFFCLQFNLFSQTFPLFLLLRTK